MMKWLFLVSIPALFLAPVATDAAEPALIPIVKEDFSKDWEKRWRVSNGDGHGFAKVVDGRLVLMCGHGLSSAWLSSPLTGPYAVSATLRWVPWENHQARTAYVVFAGPGYGPSWRTGYAVKIAQNGEVAIFKEGTQICGGTAQKALFPGAFEVLVAKDGPHITVSVDGREAART